MVSTAVGTLKKKSSGLRLGILTVLHDAWIQNISMQLEVELLRVLFDLVSHLDATPLLSGVLNELPVRFDSPTMWLKGAQISCANQPPHDHSEPTTMAFIYQTVGPLEGAISIITNRQ